MSAASIAILSTVAGAAVLAIAQMTGKQAADEMDPVKSCFFRFVFSIPLCWGLLALTTGRWWFDASVSRILTIAAIGMIAWGVGALVFFTVMKRDSMHRASPISNSLSVWVAVLSILFLGEPFFPALVGVLALLLCGVALMAPENGTGRAWKWGIPLALLVAILWSVSIVLTKAFIRGIPAPGFVLIKVMAASVFHAFFYRSSPSRPNRNGVLLSVASAITLVGGDTLFVFGVSGLTASIATPLFTTTIPFGFLLSVFVLKEKPTWKNWVGMILIFIAAALCGYYGSK